MNASFRNTMQGTVHAQETLKLMCGNVLAGLHSTKINEMKKLKTGVKVSKLIASANALNWLL